MPSIQLITDLIKQLNGRISIEASAGTEVTIQFYNESFPVQRQSPISEWGESV